MQCQGVFYAGGVFHDGVIGRKRQQRDKARAGVVVRLSVPARSPAREAHVELLGLQAHHLGELWRYVVRDALHV